VPHIRGTEVEDASATVKSARRTLEVLELFSHRHEAASVSDIASELSYPQSSTSVLLRTLVKLGYLEYDSERRLFTPTLRVLLLGAWLQDRLIGESSLVGLMHDLRDRTGLNVLIGMQRGVRVQYILTLRRADGPVQMRAGILRPICRAALGRALLMIKSDAEIGRIVRKVNVEAAPQERIHLPTFLAEMHRSRRRGWAESAGEVQQGRGVIGMVLPPLAGQPALSIGLGGTLEIIGAKRNALVEQLRNVCRSFERSKVVT
jgi:DNA-binding IclR family transcriptional regulator